MAALKAAIIANENQPGFAIAMSGFLLLFRVFARHLIS